MGKIFYIMGKSSSGKDSVYKRLLELFPMKLKTVVLYTTRPMREYEQNGVEYFFTDERELDDLQNKGKVIECRTYLTVHGPWKYFTVDDNQFSISEYHYLILGTLESYEKMKKYFGNDVLVPIYIEVDDGIRLQRALDRENKEKNPRYTELCRRFLADAEDFSEEKIQKAGINKRFYNLELEQTVSQISDYILSFME